VYRSGNQAAGKAANRLTTKMLRQGGPPRTGTSISRIFSDARMNEVAPSAPEAGGDESYRSILTRMLTAASQDHAQLRFLVYEFARRKLRKSLTAQFEEGDWAIIQERMQALESAIDKIEADCAPKSLTFVPEAPLTEGGVVDGTAGSKPEPGMVSGSAASASFVAPSSREFRFPAPMLAAPDEGFFLAVARFGQGPLRPLRWRSQLILAAILGVVIYAAIVSAVTFEFWGSRHAFAPTRTATPGSIVSKTSTSSDERAATAKIRKPGVPSIPIPSDYGAFALSNGRLIELESLSMKVPDPRVAISPAISTPSRTHLPAGKLEFILFRRDLASAAPDRATLRVIARVVRALKFDSGKPTITGIDDTWVIRSNAYPMRVAPIADNPEMILIRPDSTNLVLPAGRYALVLKGTAYDFTLDGQNADTAHCLERSDALGSPVYSECRTP
jgi:hypothetical protein